MWNTPHSTGFLSFSLFFSLEKQGIQILMINKLYELNTAFGFCSNSRCSIHFTPTRLRIIGISQQWEMEIPRKARFRTMPLRFWVLFVSIFLGFVQNHWIFLVLFVLQLKLSRTKTLFKKWLNIKNKSEDFEADDSVFGGESFFSYDNLPLTLLGLLKIHRKWGFLTALWCSFFRRAWKLEEQSSRGGMRYQEKPNRYRIKSSLIIISNKVYFLIHFICFFLYTFPEGSSMRNFEGILQHRLEFDTPQTYDVNNYRYVLFVRNHVPPQWYGMIFLINLRSFPN